MGMRPIVIDTGDQKKKLALDMGAEEFVDFKQVENVAEEIKKIAGGVGAHGVIVTAPQAYKDAISYIGDRVSGKVMCVGLRKCSPHILIPAMVLADWRFHSTRRHDNHRSRSIAVRL